MIQKFFAFVLLSIFSLPRLSQGLELSEEYRALSLRVLKNAEFKVFLPGDLELPFSYRFEFGEPYTPKPKIVEFRSSINPSKISYTFIDRFKVLNSSVLQSGRQSFQLSCVYVRGHDRRKDPSNLVPAYYLNIWIVPDDVECTGPYSGNILDEEKWNTYLHYKVFNFESFLPEMVEFKYKNNKFSAEYIKP